MLRRTLALALIGLAACSPGVATSPPLSTSGTGPATVTPRFAGFVRVEVTADGRVLVEEQQMTVAKFGAVLDGVASTTVVLYHRKDASADPPAIAKDVLDAIIAHRLPVSLVQADFNAPDYAPPPPPKN